MCVCLLSPRSNCPEIVNINNDVVTDIYIYVYVCIYICICMYMYIFIYVYIYVCVYICTYICVCVYIYMYIPGSYNICNSALQGHKNFVFVMVALLCGKMGNFVCVVRLAGWDLMGLFGRNREVLVCLL